MLDLRALPQREKLALLGTATLLLVAPIAFAFLSPLLEALLYVFAALGLPMGEASLLGARVLLEQAVVYVVLLKLLASRHAPFFRDGAWVRWRWRGAWAAPVLGGYAASVALFNLVEPLNQALWPHLEYMQEGMVAKLANPPGKSLSALLVGSLTPCVGAPLYEEVQSRAFILQALTAVVPLRAAVVLSGVLFGMFSEMLAGPNLWKGMLFLETGRAPAVNMAPLYKVWDDHHLERSHTNVSPWGLPHHPSLHKKQRSNPSSPW